MRASRTVLSILLMAFALIASSVVVAPGTAGAQPASLSVTPSTDLVDGQTVQITGQLFESGNKVFGVCALPLPADALEGFSTCASTGILPSPNPTDFPITVRRVVNGVDCATQQCVLAIATVVDTSFVELVSQELSFVGGPSVLVTKAGGTATLRLADGDSLEFAGLDLPVGATAEPVHCFGIIDCTSLGAPQAITSPTQTFSGSSERTIAAPTGRHDCVEPGCTAGIRIANIPGSPGTELVLTRPVSYQRMHFTSLPSNVSAESVVSFQLSNHQPLASIGVAQCAFLRADFSMHCTLDNSEVSDPFAEPPTSMTVQQTFTADDGTEIDCRRSSGNAGCALLFLALLDGEFITAGATPLRFP